MISNRMKKILNSIIPVLFILSVSCQKHNMTRLYVSPNGDDSNPGTMQAPLATIEKARDMFRTGKKQNILGNDTLRIILRGGTYYTSGAIEFSEKDSATGDYPLVISAFPGEKAIISGGNELSPSDFKPLQDKEIINRIVEKEARSKILTADLRSMGITDYGTFKQHGFSTAILPAQMELFIDNKPMTIAKWPNKGVVPVTDVLDPGSVPYEHDFSMRGGTIGFDYDRAKYWNHADNIWLWGYFGAGYADDNLGVEDINLKEKTIKLKQASMFGIKKSDPDEEWAGRIIGYYAYNIPEEIDMPGEYYIDHETGILYLYPPDNFEGAKITVSMNEQPLLAVENTSDILFKNLIFECGRGMGVYLEGGHHISFDNCTMRNFGTIALMMGKGIGKPDYPIHEMTGELISRRIGNLKAHNYENSDLQ
jgi:hypothetical protein